MLTSLGVAAANQVQLGSSLTPARLTWKKGTRLIVLYCGAAQPSRGGPGTQPWPSPPPVWSVACVWHIAHAQEGKTADALQALRHNVAILTARGRQRGRHVPGHRGGPIDIDTYVKDAAQVWVQPGRRNQRDQGGRLE